MARFRTLLLTLATLALAACSKAPEKPHEGPVTEAQLADVTLRVGAPNRIGNRPYLDASGELGKVPYRIEWVEFSATPALLEGLRNGDIDIGGNGGSTGLIFEVGNNGPGAIKAVAAGRSVGNSTGVTALIVRKDSRLRSLADLRGKRVSVLQGTGTQYILERDLERAGIKPSEIQFSSLTNDMAAAALVSGHIDVLGIWEPQASVLLTRADLKLLQWIGGDRDSYALQFASAKALADPLRAAAIEDFLKRLARSTVWVSQHPEAYSERMSKLARIDPKVALSITRKTSYRYGLDAAQQDELKQSFATETEFWRKRGVVKRAVDIDSLFDFRFQPALREASGDK